MDPNSPEAQQMRATATAEQCLGTGWMVSIFLVGAIAGAALWSEATHRRTIRTARSGGSGGFSSFRGSAG